MRILFSVFALHVLLVFTGCNSKHVSEDDDWANNSYSPVAVKYVAYSKDSATSLLKSDSLHKLILCMINRVDVNYLTKVDTLIVPDTFVLDLFSYSPFPVRYKTLRPVKKMILYSQAIQAFGAYENGKLVKWGPISTGKESTQTPSRLFFTNWRAKETVSTVDDEWIMQWYFNLGNKEGVSMHLYEMPGYPASHACVRLLLPDAMWFYNWCEEWVLSKKDEVAVQGTPVLVFGQYDFNSPKPWYRLAENSKALIFSEGELDREIQPLLSTILNAQHVRDSVNAVN